MKQTLWQKLEACNDMSEDKIIALVPDKLHAANKAFVRRWLVVDILADGRWDNPLGIGLEPYQAVEMAYQFLVATQSCVDTNEERPT